jgi:hypothetical protein
VNLPSIILDWFAARGWAPRRHQLEMVDAASEGRHALLVASTGAGKTLAGFLPTLADLIPPPPGEGDQPKAGGGARAEAPYSEGRITTDLPLHPDASRRGPPPRAGEE